MDSVKMKIAITGKGGVGKTTLSGTLAFILSQAYKVFAIDADPDMNLASSMGIHYKITPISKMRDLIKEELVQSQDQHLEKFSINPVSDLGCMSVKVRMMTPKTPGHGNYRQREGTDHMSCICSSGTMRNLILKKTSVILDMEAEEHLGRRTAEAVDVMIIVVEPGLKSLETAERIKRLAADIGIRNIAVVINKVSNKAEEEFVTDKLNELGLEVLGSIPRDDNVILADMEGKILLDYPESVALKSIKEIGENLLNYNPRN